MKTWKITPLDVGTLDFEKSVATYLRDCGLKMRVQNVMFLVEELDGPGTVIVDTGFESVERTMAVHGQQVWRTDAQKPEKLLINRGIDPESIGTVIHTHLHYDHSGNNHLFPKAKFHVQRSELQYAFAPLPDEVTPYFSPLMGEKPSFWGSPFEILDGDCEVADGIRCITAPGHTPGSQMVLVDTPGGTYCLAGDNAFLYENIEHTIAPGHVYSRADWFTSMSKARQLSDRILPSHDPLLFERDVAPFM
jgi:glyoxylase-like metal-dependent hydrolase (beta-lactamase superfamily II)